MWCLRTCTQLEDGDSVGGGGSQDEPVVDLVAVLLQIAWKTVRRIPPTGLTLGERICGLEKVLKLEVDNAFISISHGDALKMVMDAPGGKRRQISAFPAAKADSGDDDEGRKKDASGKGTTFLFESQFHNNTGSKQTYSFKTERTTRSTVELSMQRGFTLGQSLEMNFKIPMGLSGKLGGQIGWSFSRAKVSHQEEIVTWAVDSQVEVAPNSTGVATLAVQERRSTADFFLDCVIRPNVVGVIDKDLDSGSGSGSEEEAEGEAELQPQTLKFPVFVRRRTTGELLMIANVPRSHVVDAQPKHFKKCKTDVNAIMCTLRMQAHSVCAVNQRVWLKEATLVPSDARPAMLHQNSTIVENNGDGY